MTVTSLLIMHAAPRPEGGSKGKPDGTDVGCDGGWELRLQEEAGLKGKREGKAVGRVKREEAWEVE